MLNAINTGDIKHKNISKEMKYSALPVEEGEIRAGEWIIAQTMLPFRESEQKESG
jgi:hypothetical protein